MPIDESFFNAEFYKFVGKLNRMLSVGEKEILHFSFNRSGFVDIGCWDKKNLKSEFFSLNVLKEGALPNETVYEVPEQ
jgi:hypothetical protein